MLEFDDAYDIFDSRPGTFIKLTPLLAFELSAPAFELWDFSENFPCDDTEKALGRGGTGGGCDESYEGDTWSAVLVM